MTVRAVGRGVSDAPVRRELDGVVTYMTGQLGPLLKEIRERINVQAGEKFRIPFRLDYFTMTAAGSSFASVDSRATEALQAFLNRSDFPSNYVPGCTLKAYLAAWASLSAAGTGEIELYNQTTGAAVDGSTIELSSTSEALAQSGDLLEGLTSGLNQYRIRYRYTSGTPNVRLRDPCLLLHYDDGS